MDTNIHWFPGHMTKALRQMKEDVKLVDCFLYVLDARAPFSSLNPSIDEIVGHKPVLYIFHKSDLAEQADTVSWLKEFEKMGKKAIKTSNQVKSDQALIIKELLELNKAKIEHYLNKGVKKNIRAMVIGVPNTGKSTLINMLAKAKKTQTGDTPGITRGRQWISIDKNIELLDTPGVLYPDFKDQQKAFRLAFLGSVKLQNLDIMDLASEGLTFLRKNYKDSLTKRYGITNFDDLSNPEIFSQIAKVRGHVLKGGELDIEAAALTLVLDFRKGSLGKLIMEKPDK